MRDWGFYIRQLVVGLFCTISAAIFQGASVIEVHGIKPNLVLVTLIVLTFVVDSIVPYLAFVFAGILFIRFSTGFDPALFVLMGIALITFLIRRNLPWHEGVNNAVVIVLSTALFYLILDAHFFSFDPFTLFLETVYNVVIGILLFPILKVLIGQRKLNF